MTDDFTVNEHLEHPHHNFASGASHRGRWTVVGMFGFAILMITLLFTYWHFYTAPFRTLQYAIAAKYPASSPRIVGGQHKSHKAGFPKVLRIVVYISTEEFDPEAATATSEERALKLAQMAFEYQDVDSYDELQIVLLQKVPEGARKRWTAIRQIAEWREMLAT